MLEAMIKERNLMPIWDESASDWKTRREEIKRLLQEHVYGFMPKMHDSLTWTEESVPYTFCAGKANLKKVTLTACFGEDKFSFPVYASIPKSDKKLPFFVFINFRDNVPDRYLPVEEICDRGYGVISFCYNDVTFDSPTEKLTSDPLPEILYKNIEKQPNHAGKIRMWAWAASCAMDYALTLDSLDPERAAVAGHSRLGKTALVAGMLDERFKAVFSNDSGCSGAAVSRGKQGETIEKITRVFPHWFCENYKKYSNRENEMPFDQHFLVAASAPRNVYVASAENDLWADPESEYLSCCAADEVYKKLGMKGFIAADCPPAAFVKFHQGDIGYHLRHGDHYISREDWNLYIDFLDAHRT